MAKRCDAQPHPTVFVPYFQPPLLLTLGPDQTDTDSIRKLRNRNCRAGGRDTVPDDQRTTPGCTSDEIYRDTPGGPLERQPRTPRGRWCIRPNRHSPSRWRGKGTFPWCDSNAPGSAAASHPTTPTTTSRPQRQPTWARPSTSCVLRCSPPHAPRAALPSWGASVAAAHGGRRGTHPLPG